MACSRVAQDVRKLIIAAGATQWARQLWEREPISAVFQSGHVSLVRGHNLRLK